MPQRYNGCSKKVQRLGSDLLKNTLPTSARLFETFQPILRPHPVQAGQTPFKGWKLYTLTGIGNTPQSLKTVVQMFKDDDIV